MHDYPRATFLIEQEMTLFPLATLKDIYKLFFQNCHGSGHFMRDLSFVKDFITKELHEINLRDYQYPDYDISYLFQIKRISLVSIMIGKYDASYIADRFLELAVKPQILSLAKWKREWADIKQLALGINPQITDDFSKANIDLSNSVHHSDIYRQSYNPHYRICNL